VEELQALERDIVNGRAAHACADAGFALLQKRNAVCVRAVVKTGDSCAVETLCPPLS
jgi:hypothetical protein